MEIVARFSDEEEHVGELWSRLGPYGEPLEPLRADDLPWEHDGVASLRDVR
jgi:hypothetical protein